MSNGDKPLCELCGEPVPRGHPYDCSCIDCYLELRADRAELLVLAKKLEDARKAWHEDFGVPVSQTYANFLEAIGALIDGIRARKLGGK